MSLTIRNVTPSDHSSVGQILKRTWSWFIAESELGWSTYQSIEHPESHDAAAIDPYFNQFALAGVADAASRSDRGVRYQPAARVTLSDSDGYWVLRRLFQKTEMIPNSVFVDTYVELRHQDVAGTDLFAFLAEMDALADQAVGLEFRDGPE